MIALFDVTRPETLRKELLMERFEIFAQQFIQTIDCPLQRAIEIWAERNLMSLDMLLSEFTETPEETAALVKEARVYDKKTMRLALESESVLRPFLTQDNIEFLVDTLDLSGAEEAEPVPDIPFDPPMDQAA